MLFFVKIAAVLCVAIFNLLLAVLVLVRNPKSNINRTFFAFELFFFFWCITLTLYEHPIILNSLFWIQVTYLIVATFVALLLGFSFIFPISIYRSIWWLSKLTSVVYLAFTAWLVFTTDLMVAGVVDHAVRGTQTILGPMYIWWTVITWVMILWAVVNFSAKQRLTSPTQKIQMQYLWVGFFIFGLAVCIPDVLIPLVWGDTSYFFVSVICNVIFSLPVAYIIVKHRLFDIRFVIARSVSYILLVFALGFFYSAGLFVVGTFVTGERTANSNLIYSTLLALIAAFTFQPLLRYFDNLTRNIFYKNHYNSELLLGRLGRIMASTLTLQELTDSFLKELTTQIKITGGSITVSQGHSIQWWRTIGEVKNIELHEDELNRLQSAASKSPDYILMFEEMEDNEERRIMNEHAIAAFISLRVKDDVIGSLTLTGKDSGDIYSVEDINLFKIIAPELTVAIKNALAYEEIKHFNITLANEVKSATNELQKANTRLKDLDKLKDEFVSVASHELRTPMTAIKSYLWMALAGKGGELSDKQKYYLDRAYNSTDRLIKLVNDMLNVSRIESGRVSLTLKKIEMPILVEDVIAEVKPRADELGVKINVERPTQYLPPVIADVDKIKEVLINLLGNSMKFTPSGGLITVSFEIKEEEIVTHVKDNGKGIDSDDISKLFQKFGLLRGSYTSNQVSQGTGLGLYICKSIIALHKGEIWGHSEGRGKGAEFSFSLKIYNNAFAEQLIKEQQSRAGIEIIPTQV